MSTDIFKDGSLSFQPVIDLVSGSVASYEALSRFDYFAHFDVQRKINFIEENGLAFELDTRVFKNILELLKDPEFFHNKRVNINITGESFSSERFLDWVSPVIKTIPNRSLMGIEITETLPITDMQICQAIINLMVREGVHVYLDDIGSGHMHHDIISGLKGYSGFKLDGTIINQWESSPDVVELTKRMGKYAQENELSVTAEFADSRERFEKAIEYGLTYAQGFGLGQPLPIPENPLMVAKRLAAKLSR